MDLTTVALLLTAYRRATLCCMSGSTSCNRQIGNGFSSRWVDSTVDFVGVTAPFATIWLRNVHPSLRLLEDYTRSYYVQFAQRACRNRSPNIRHGTSCVWVLFPNLTMENYGST